MAKAKKIGAIKSVKIVKKLSSGMYETSDGERVPPYTGVKVGDVLKVENGKFEFPDNKEQTLEPVDPLQKENEELKKRVEKLEKLAGAKGSEVKTVGANAKGETKVTLPNDGVNNEVK